MNTLDPLLTSRLNALSASQDAWAVSIVPLGVHQCQSRRRSDVFRARWAGDLFKKITSTSGGIKFGAQIELSTQLVAMDEKNATALGDVVKFLGGDGGHERGIGQGRSAYR